MNKDVTHLGSDSKHLGPDSRHLGPDSKTLRTRSLFIETINFRKLVHFRLDLSFCRKYFLSKIIRFSDANYIFLSALNFTTDMQD